MAIIAEDFRHILPEAEIQRPLFRDAGLHLALYGGILAATLLGMVSATALGWRGAATALVCYGLMALLIMLGLARHAHPSRFGLANAITLARAALTALLFGVAGEWLLGGVPAIGGSWRWALAFLATLILILDGLDGPAARRNGMASPFGAHFDMETDALFILAVCWLVMATSVVGTWILICGSLHYGFLSAGLFAPGLKAPLKPLLRRKVFYVVQAVAPIIALTPVCPPNLGWVLCCAAFLLVLYSFAADAVMLLLRA